MLDHRVEQGRGREDVGGQALGQAALVRLAREVYDGVGRLGLEDRGDGIGVGAVDAVPGAIEALGLDDPVEADDQVAAVGEPDRDDPSDAAGGAGEEYSHGPNAIGQG